MTARRHLFLAIVTYAAVVAQVTLRGRVAIAGFHPDFLLLALALAVWSTQGRSSILWAAAIGLISDCLCAGRLGSGMFVAIVATLGSQQLRRRGVTPDGITDLLRYIVFLILVLLGQQGIRLASSSAPFVTSSWLLQILGDGMYTVLLGLSCALLHHVSRRSLGSVLPSTSGEVRRRFGARL